MLDTPVIVVVGPTASGKSALSIQLAKEHSCEVVNADSMQVYKGMDIGTAKVAPADREVPHFGLDIANPGEPYSAALFQEYARRAFEDIDSRGKGIVLTGGTGFYVRAAIDDYDFAPGEQIGNEVRDRYNAMLEEIGPRALWETLREIDPQSAADIHPNDSKRVVRAFEMHEAGESYHEQLSNLGSIGQAYPAIFIGINVNRDILNQRIDARVDEMRELGLVDEVKGLIAAGFRDGVTSKQAIGYKEIASALDGDISLDEAFEQIKQSTRRYAKRQRTWFKKDSRINWIDGNDGNVSSMLDQADRILDGFGYFARQGRNID